MIKIYKFTYGTFEAEVTFEVDLEKFTKEHALATLNFFTWDFDKENDLISEVMKKYAMMAIKLASFNNYNTYGIIDEFENLEGFCKIDGSSGIKIVDIMPYEFDEEFLDMEYYEKNR